MSAPPKYIFVNGVMKLNPAHAAATGSAPSTAPPDSLAVVSSMGDVAAATEVQASNSGAPMQLSDSTVSSLEMMMDSGYTQGFGAPTPLDGSTLLDGDFSSLEHRFPLINIFLFEIFMKA